LLRDNGRELDNSGNWWLDPIERRCRLTSKEVLIERKKGVVDVVVLVLRE